MSKFNKDVSNLQPALIGPSRLHQLSADQKPIVKRISLRLLHRHRHFLRAALVLMVSVAVVMAAMAVMALITASRVTVPRMVTVRVTVMSLWLSTVGITRMTVLRRHGASAHHRRRLLLILRIYCAASAVTALRRIAPLRIDGTELGRVCWFEAVVLILCPNGSQRETGWRRSGIGGLNAIICGVVLGALMARDAR